MGVYVGRVSWEKAVDRLLRIFAALKEELPDLHLLLVGGGTSLEACRQLAHTLDMDGRVTFTGPESYERIGGVLTLADFFVSASVSEVASTDLHRGRGRRAALHWHRLARRRRHDCRRRNRVPDPRQRSQPGAFASCGWRGTPDCVQQWEPPPATTASAFPPTTERARSPRPFITHYRKDNPACSDRRAFTAPITRFAGRH